MFDLFLLPKYNVKFNCVKTYEKRLRGSADKIKKTQVK